MPCGIKVEVAHGIDFLQVINTTLTPFMQQQWIFLRIPLITLTYIFLFIFCNINYF
jgi:hypothetical protein